MSVQSILIIVLLALVVLLSFLLYRRIARERKQHSIIEKMRAEDFSAFLRANSFDGDITSVARKVSDLLITSFGCERIVFLRKKRSFLELNYFYGIKGFQREDFRLTFSAELAELLRQDFLPRSTKILRPYLPDPLSEQVHSFNLDAFFPVYWRENLYGVYLIQTNPRTDSASFQLLVAGLAQSLSAAYHIKWHESKLESLNKQRETDVKRSAASESPEELTRILRLVRHRRSDTLIPNIIDTFKVLTGIKELAFVYDDRNRPAELRLLKEGLKGSLNAPERKTFEYFVKMLADQPLRPLKEIRAENPEAAKWLNSLTDRGLEFGAVLPLSSRRAGFLAWNGSEDLNRVRKHLHLFRAHISDFVENAEEHEQVEAMSYTDNLTSLANQRYFFKRLSEEISRASRYKRKLALIIFDLDELKSVNDTYGHLAGDGLISQMGEILRNSIRTIDIIARYGGDEFCVIMPEADQLMCVKFMERLQETIHKTAFAIEGREMGIKCTVSMGAALFPDHAIDPRKLVFQADMALLKAKEGGRNRALLACKHESSENLLP